MTKREQYQAYQERRKALRKTPTGGLWLDHLDRYVHPFKIFGNVWYVGDSDVCIHLIDTGDGLLLIDSGFCNATALLIQAIWEAGFNPADVKWILHSHGHADHFGGANFFQRLFGTKLYLGEPDARMFRENPELSLIFGAHNDCETLFVPDYEIQDGDILTFGNVTVTCYLVPGHTDGCIACFFDAHEGEQVCRCGYFGGFGFNTLRKDFLIERGDPEFKIRQIYLDSLAKVRNQTVDIFLGNHCVNNQTLECRQQQLADPEGPNPFIDRKRWGAYLDQMRDKMVVYMNDPANQ